MEIYRDADINGHTPGGPGHRTIRTRKPLTPHNRQTPMQAFRQSLKTASNKEFDAQGAHSTNPTKSATKSVAFAKSTEKGNDSSVPTSVQSFRQSLRGRGGGSKLLAGRSLGSPRGGVLSSRFATTGSVGKTTSTALGPPQRVVPKTPNSLLRSEMGEDDSMEEESFLVSPPPDALWNRLETSTTGLVVVSPQVATQIHETLSARKLKKERDQTLQDKSPLFSPPLQPRKLATSTVKKLSNRKSSFPVSSADSASAAKSPWFSLEDTESVVSTIDASETPVVRTNLFKTSSQLKTPNGIKTLALRSSDDDHLTEDDSPNNDIVMKEAEIVEQPSNIYTPSENSTEKETGLLDFSHMFSSSKKAATGPPAHLLDRLQHRSIRCPNDSVGGTKSVERQKRAVPKVKSVKKESSTKKAQPPTEDVSPVVSWAQDGKVEVEEKAANADAKKNETGLMDFTHLFSASKTKRSPPSRLMERLQHSSKKSPKTQAGDTGKTTKSRGAAESRGVKKSNPIGYSSKNFLKGKSDSLVSHISGNPSASALVASRQRNTNKGGRDIRIIDEKAQRVLVETKNTRVSRNAQRGKLSQHQSATKHVNRNRFSRSSTLDSPKKPTNKIGNHCMRGSTTQVTKTDPIGRMSGKYAAMATPKHGITMGSASGRIKASSVVSSKSFNESHVNDWAEKQSNAFVKWINYTISPGETDEEKELDEIGRSPSCAGLRMLLVHRQQSQLRMKASGVFYGDHMGKVKARIHAEIGKGRLSIRSDRDLYYDLTLRRQVTTLLLSYTAPWLRLGLEAMYGECIEVGNTAGDPMKAQPSQTRSALGKFIVNRILSDASVLKKYTKGKCKIPSGRFEKQFRAEMRSLVLYRIMLLVFFLDQAKHRNILDKMPRLFVKGSQVKSSREVLLSLCRICLSSEGDFIKHLSRIGLKVTYKQDPVDELDLDVHNLATDLRDGTCLTRLTEITTAQPAKALVSKLRLPPISRLQKLHNLNLALGSLRKRGVIVPKDVDAHHIVDGHREMVLKVMWSIIAHSCMGKLLEDDMVEREIENVQRSNQARRKIQGHLSLHQHGKTGHKVYSLGTDPKEVLASLLLRWSQAVCSSFGLKLSDFTTSFADGRALCYLIHYYHPTVIRLDEIMPTSIDNENLSAEDVVRNERMNSILASQRASELGGIPKMLPYCDSMNPPDEQSMLLCLTYLCSRLMESSKEILASILIQQSYRKYNEKMLLERKREAALTILRVWKRYKGKYFNSQRRRYSRSIAVVEAFALANWERLLQLKKARLQKERMLSAVELVQRVFRGTQGRKQHRRLLREQSASITIQASYRGSLVIRRTKQLRLQHNAAVLVQTMWRRFASRRKNVNRTNAVRTIQKYTRGRLARRQIERQEIAASIVQKAWWNFVQNWRVRWAATTIQSVWRGSLARSELVRRILEEEDSNDQAAIAIQSAWRGFSAQVEFQTVMLDIVTIQSLGRRRIALNRRCTMVNALAKLQCALRCWLARRHLQINLRDVKAAITCQCAIRSWLSVRRMVTVRHEYIAAVIIQSQWRRYTQNVSYCLLRSTVVSCQALLRGSVARREILSWNQSASSIQSAWRDHSWNIRLKVSATVIQKTWRARSAALVLCHSLAAIRSMQRYWRGFIVRVALENEQFAATVIQSSWRAFFAKREFTLDVLEVIFVQGAVRRYLAKRAADHRRLALHKIQHASRCFLAVQELRRLQRAELEHMECHKVAIFLQAMSRRWLQQSNYQRYRRNSVVLQTWWRSQVAQCRYRSFRNGMVTLQSVVRSSQARTKFANDQTNAIVIQSQWRCFAACIRYRTLVGDVITVQSVVRRFCVLQMQKRQHLGASKIQSHARGIAVRSSLSIYHAHASIIQAAFRGFVARVCYSVDVVDIIIIQSLGRQWLVKQMLMKQEYAALKIQSVARQRASKKVAFVRQRQVKIQEFRNSMACKLQSAYRGYKARKHIHALHIAAVQIQSTFRGFAATTAFMELQRGVIVVQSLVRKSIAVKRVARMFSAIITVQTCVRRMVARRQLYRLQREQSLSYRKNRSSIQIQLLWRGYVARKIVSRHAAARKIQKTWRCFVTHIDFLVQVMSVLSMQAQVRRYLAMKAYEKKYGCVEKIQAYSRGCAARDQVRKMKEAATKIQAAYRSYLDRSIFGVQKWAATEMQRMTRGFCARLNLEIEHYAATEIQRIWRGFDRNVEYTCILHSTLKVQSCVRRYVVEKSYKRLQFNRHWKASIIQKQYRAHVSRQRMSRAARTIQTCFREYLARWRANMLTRATVRLQAAFRARATRETRPKAIANVAHRVHRANKRAQEDPTQSLGCRTNSALAVLQASTSLAEIMDAVKTLESATRFSVDCCEVFTNANAAKILLDLIRACNRSLPHVELVHWILLTLENVGQHTSLLIGFADCKSAEVFLDKVQMFRDKDGIFCLSVSLLQRIVFADQDVKDFCGMHEHLKRLKGIYKLSLRRARPATTVAKKKTENIQKYERRETFDRSEALKVLGELIDFVQVPSETPSSILQNKHFF
mmetsp:Transcript_16947/g.41278  ORF Transcript_16947/g.41278 Transcript_16947/m.41278 type:complete len:2524 (+) Transcript_16947:69-7640(+)